MKTLHINLILCANFIATNVAYYERCYDEFSVCLITNTDDPKVGSKYKLNQDDAYKWCKENSSSLVFITNETVQFAIESFINDSSAKMDSDVITYGYRYNQSTWEWINGNKDNTFLTHHNYGYGYLEISTDGLISMANDRQPTSERKFICSYPSTYPSNNTDFCLTDYQLRSRCYRIHSRNVTWFEARHICLKEDGSDLATFEYNLTSRVSELGRKEEYWIGLRREQWIWYSKETNVDIKYTNWEDEKPSDTGGNGLCVRVGTGKWTNCDYTTKYRHICIQNYASGSASTLTSTMISSSSKQASTQIRVDTTKEDIEGLDNKGFPLGLGIGGGFLLLLIVVVIAVIAFVKHRRRPPSTVYTYKDEAPNTVHAIVLPNTHEPAPSPSESAPNQTVYESLRSPPERTPNTTIYEPLRSPPERTPNTTIYEPLRSSPERTPNPTVYEPLRSPDGESPNPVVYEELILASRGDSRSKGALPKSEYVNSQQQIGSVYANSAQTRV